MRKEMPFTSVGFGYLETQPLLLLQGIGRDEALTTAYRWNGLERQDEHCLLQCTISGRGSITVEGAAYTLEAGSVFLVEIPGDHCYWLPEDSERWEVFYMEFSKEALPFWQQIWSEHGPVITLASDSSFMELAWQVYEKALTDRIGDIYEWASYSYRLVMELLRSLARSGQEKRLPAAVERCKEFIETHYAADIGLDDMAAAAGMSKFHLSRAFGKELGVSPSRYLTDIRLEQAMRLLLSSDTMKLDEVAERCGFANANYFGKVFKKHVGETPDAFRHRDVDYDIKRVLSRKQQSGGGSAHSFKSMVSKP